jgi:hypothetical protein
METGSPRAVFISYAHDDIAAAQQAAEALRSNGVEVWFDLNELRGGDAWDQKIRRQIKACTLFLPVISARTQKRSEGYFRLEWKLSNLQGSLEKPLRLWISLYWIMLSLVGVVRIPLGGATTVSGRRGFCENSNAACGNSSTGH